MSVFRIYPLKSNTISSGVFEDYNSGQNAVAELWFGGSEYFSNRNSISRHLAKYDIEKLKSKIEQKEILSGNVTSYKLKMKNSIPRDAVLEHDFTFQPLKKQIATSFDLISFPVNKEWDEGIGYDLIKTNYLVKQKGNIHVTGYSNWNYAQRNISWDNPGIYLDPTAVTTNLYSQQHFDLGNEDMNMNIDGIVENWLTGGSKNHGLAISYRRDYELITSDTRYISSFLTEKTNSAFKPYIEVSYDQVIKDDRLQVTNNKKSRLFLYTFSGNSFENYYSAGTVNILRADNSVLIPNLTPKQLKKGVYYVDVFMSAATQGEMYKDVWSDVTFNPGYDQQDFENFFTIKGNYYLNSKPSVNDYILTTYGIDNNSVVRQDEIIKIFCDLRVNYSQSQPSPDFDLKYSLIMNNQDIVVPWTSVDRLVRNNCHELSFNLDASWLLHNQTYDIKFKIEELGSSRIMPEDINFKVLRGF